MAKFKVLYNPFAGSVKEQSLKDELSALMKDDETEFFDITKIDDQKTFYKSVPDDVNILIAGGDGTLNRFINDTDGLNLKNDIYYYAAGNGNDFWTDIGYKKGDAPVKINEYLTNLPTVTVGGKNYKFLNGVGYGIDGYCCETGDKLKAAGKKVNYTAIAVKGLLFHFKPSTATVTVDGKTKTYKKCWIAPTMNGRYYGGGMIPTPAQNRLGEERTLSVCLMFGAGKIRTLMIFPKIFKGEHVNNKKMVDVLSGRKITVRFNKPTALQIDGETISGVTEYTVTGAALAMEKDVSEAA